MGNICDCLNTGAKYDNYDWDELPEDAKAAATTLGYTKAMWDADKEPETAKKDWENLTKEEKDAAGVLGFDEEMWDEED